MKRTMIIFFAMMLIGATACDKQDGATRTEKSMSDGVDKIKNGTKEIASDIKNAGDKASNEIDKELDAFKTASKNTYGSIQSNLKDSKQVLDKLGDKVDAETTKEWKTLEDRAAKLNAKMEKAQDKASKSSKETRKEISEDLNKLSNDIDKFANDVKKKG